jgi:aspartate/methionine/tyrosine aminotransferase
VTAAGGQARLLPCGPAQRFQLDAQAVRQAWTPATRAVLLASPSNPTGTCIAPATLAELVATVRELGGLTLVDEIYLELGFGDSPARSALALGEDVIAVGSFSKYFGMTGWRLGWLVLPEELVAPVEKLAQNLYICASTIAQEAALACFTPATLAQCDARVQTLRQRRDRVVSALESLGLPVPVVPDGAFYVWFDTRKHAGSSWDFCIDMMQRAHVALTPGRDFGHADTARYARLSYACSDATLDAALERLARELGRASSVPPDPGRARRAG